MQALHDQNICVIDLETLKSASECRICGAYPDEEPRLQHHRCQPLGWDNKNDLGLSIGCAYWYTGDRYEFFDGHTLEQTMRCFVERQPLLVSFNGIAFDFPLMRGILRERGEVDRLRACADTSFHDSRFILLQTLCDSFKTLCVSSYDLLAEIWQVDPTRKFERGLNSLDAICQANGLPAKEMDGATDPRLWQAGRYAEVTTYCMNDVVRTRKLFEMVCAGQPIRRGDGQPITLPAPPQFSLA